ncbi:MAG TPA: DNA primase [Savagea sp.]
MKIEQHVIEAVQSKTDIVSLISEYVDLEKKGKDWSGLCPFHDENTPSFSVSEDKQLYYCFGCGAGGSAITFVMEHDNKTFPEAVQQLAERIGIETGLEGAQFEASARKTEEMERHRDLYDAHELAAHFYHHLLMNTVEGERALNYLLERGFTEEELSSYSIGWALPQNDALRSVLVEDGYKEERMVEAGLLIATDYQEHAVDRFRNRIMFPLEDENGRVVGFSGRLLEKDEKLPKYMNSPESPIFDKSAVLYNAHRARRAIRKENEVIVYEGFMDSIASTRHGIEQTVAVMGTSLSTKHLHQMKRMTKEVTICCDGDDAGWTASYRFAKLAMQEGMHVKVALLPNGMDPDDYLAKHGAEAFQRNVLDVAHSFLSFVVQYAQRGKNLTLDYEIEQFIDEVLRELAFSTSTIERELTVRRVSDLTGVSTETIEQQLLKYEAKRARTEREETKEMKPRLVVERPVERNYTERMLLYYALTDHRHFVRIMEEGDVFNDEAFRVIMIHLAAFYERRGEPDPYLFINELEDRDHHAIVANALTLELTSNDEQAVEDCIVHLRRERIEQSIKHHQQLIHEAERANDFTRALEHMKEVVQLKQSLERSK